MHYQTPFLYIFHKWGVKPSLLAFFLFFLVLAMWRFIYKEDYELDKAPWQPYQTRLVAMLSLGYLCIFPLGWFLEQNENTPFPTNLIDAFLTYETLLSWGLLLISVIGLICIDKNKLSFLRVVTRAVNIVLVLSVFSTVIARQIRIEKYGNWVLLLILGLAFVILATCDLKPTLRKNKESVFFEPLETFESLLPQRRTEANRLVGLLESAPNSSLSICVNGGWGSGKTSVVNGALEKLTEKSSDKYEIIRINAMDMDTQESLIAYVFEQIRQCLKKHGAYVGPGSEYRSVVTSLLKTATNASVATLIESRLFPVSGDYRTRKKQLENLVDEVMQDRRIIIVLDDIERCAPDKAKQFIYFTKEIATMECCTVIFVTDYPQLEKALADFDTSDTRHSAEYSFYEKFFNYRIDLGGIDVPSAIHVMDEKHSYLQAHRYAEFKRPPTVFAHISERLQIKIKESKDRFAKAKDEPSRITVQENTDKQQKLLERFSDMLNNPRKLQKLFHTIETYCRSIDHAFADNPPSNTESYFKLIRLDEILFALAYIDVCIPTEAKEIRLHSEQYFEAFSKKENTADKELVAALLNDVLFSTSIFGEDIKYEQRKALRFVETFFRQPESLNQTIDLFTSQEEEWINALDTGNAETLQRDWIRIVEAVIKAPFSVSQTEQPEAIQVANERFKKLLEFARGKVVKGEWSGDRAFSFFDPAFHFDHFLSQELCVMKTVLEILCVDDVLKAVTSDTEKKIARFSEQYAYTRMTSTTNLLYFYTQDNEDTGTPEAKILSAAQERFMFNASIETHISEYLTQLNRLKNDPFRYKARQVGEFNQLNALSDEIEDYLNRNGLLKFPDIQAELNLMRQSTQDMEAFADLQRRLRHRVGVNSTVTADVVRTGNIDEIIAYFDTSLTHRGSVDDTVFQHTFSALFDRIRYDTNLKLDEKQLQSLDTISTKYCEATYRKPFFYRKVLMDYRNTHNARQKAAERPVPPQ